MPGWAARAKRGFRVDALLAAPEMPMPDAIDAVLVAGAAIEKAVFFHRPSRTVIFTDLIENFELARIRNPLLRWLVRLSSANHPHGKAPIDLR